jgi:hypothetical protein
LTEEEEKGHFGIDWGRQGGVFFLYIVVFLGYYGIIANTVMFDPYGNWISFIEMNRTILIYTYQSYVQSFFMPAILLVLVCLMLTFKEDIPQYGIKASIWIVPLLITEGFIFYFMMFGLSMEPFIWQFMTFEGYLNILILYGLVLLGSLSGMKLKQRRLRKKISLLE